MKKKLQDFPQEQGDCYQVANWLYDLEPGDIGYSDPAKATEAAELISEAGWQFVGYNDFGECVYRKPEVVK